MQAHWQSLIENQGRLSKFYTRISFRVFNRPCMSHLCSISNESCSLIPCMPVIFCHALLSYRQQESLYRLILSPTVKNWCHLITFQIKALSQFCCCKDSDWLLNNQNAARLLLADNSTNISVNEALVNYVKAQENKGNFVKFLSLLSK